MLNVLKILLICYFLIAIICFAVEMSGDDYTTSPLHLAATQDDAVILEELLLMNRTSINARDEQGNTPLHVAIKALALKAFNVLIRGGALNIPSVLVNDVGQNVLQTAAIYANSTFVNTILDAQLGKTMMEMKDTLNKSTPLHYAVANGHFLTVQVLLDQGANIEARNAAGQTPLILAVRQNNTKMFRLLVDRKAWIYAADDVPFAVIHHAVVFGAVEITRLLIERHGVDKDFTAPNRQLHYTPLMVVAGSSLDIPESMDTLKMLIVDYGANIRFSTKYGERTPLGSAALNSRFPKLELLLKHGADPNFCGGCTDNKIPLNLATGHSEMAEDWRDDEMSCGSDVPKIVSLLIRYGADVNRGSPLCNLVWLKHKKRPGADKCQPGNIAVAMRILIENGANLDACGQRLNDCKGISFYQCLEKDPILKEAFDSISDARDGGNITIAVPTCKTTCKYQDPYFASEEAEDVDSMCRQQVDGESNLSSGAATLSPGLQKFQRDLPNLYLKINNINKELQQLKDELEEMILHSSEF